MELLLKNPGEIVSRKALREKLWPDTTVAYEQNLNTAVNKLRVLLRDSARRPRFIETLPGRGYRFVSFVERQGRRAYSAMGKRKLVVLPFEYFGNSADQKYFAEGLFADLISQLAQLNPRRLGVIARTSAIQYMGTRTRSTSGRQPMIECWATSSACNRMFPGKLEGRWRLNCHSDCRSSLITRHQMAHGLIS